MGFAFGLAVALTWALDTVILGIALGMPAFTASAAAVAFASFVSTFVHDTCSAICAFAYMGIKRKLGETWKAFRIKAGLVVIIAAIIGAPVGMTGYVTAINNIGPGYAAAISAFFPAFGVFMAAFVLREHLKWYQWAGCSWAMIAIAVLGYTPADGISGDWAVCVIGALATVAGWGSEGVIIDWGLQKASVDDEVAMQIRQTTSSVTYVLVLLPIMGGWGVALNVMQSSAMPFIVLAAVIGTSSYIFYYKAIAVIGAQKAMALNITYSARAIPFSFVILGSIPELRGVVCAIVIIFGAVLTATDVTTLFRRGAKA